MTTAAASTHISARVFKIAAVAEALSWVGLLISMFFKWVVDAGEGGVKVFGPIHGGVFVAYVVICIWTAVVHKWTAKNLVLGLLSSIPPLMTLWFERHALRHGLLTMPHAQRPLTRAAS